MLIRTEFQKDVDKRRWALGTTFVFFLIMVTYITSFREPALDFTGEDVELSLSDAANVHAPSLEDGTNMQRFARGMKTVVVKAGDTFSTLLNRVGINRKTQNALLAQGEAVAIFKHLHPNQKIDLDFDEEHGLTRLTMRYTKAQTISLLRQDDGSFAVEHKHHPQEKHIVVKGAVIKNSLFGDGHKAEIDDKVLLELANIFAWDIDFALDIQPEDSFKVIYEEQHVDGEYIGSGAILAAEFITSDKIYHAYRYTDAEGNSDYYNEDGYSLRKAFIRTPVKFSRISSYFSMGRKHPILHTLRAHRGVDYAAPLGTPIKATGFGQVLEVGWKNGYGNTIVLKHGKRYTTLYGHLSKFAKGLKAGKSVQQGEIIGFVGSTGLATGPHLHYEFRIDGQHHDPLTVALPRALPIADKFKTSFKKHISKVKTWLAASELPAQITSEGDIHA